MENELYKIRSFLIGIAELGAVQNEKNRSPKEDKVTQRQAYLFFKRQDTKFGGEFTHGEAWIKKMVKEEYLHPVREGKAKNSPVYFSRVELLAVRAACDAYKKNIFKGTKL